MAEWSLSIFDKFGVRIAEVKPSDLQCSWLMNDVGLMQFTLPKTDPAVREDYLQPGNFVYFQHDSAPDWGGVIWTPRNWSADTVTVTAHESAFQWRRFVTPGEYTLNGAPGSIYNRLIWFVNSFGYDTRIEKGEIYFSDISLEFQVGDYTVLDCIRALQEVSREAWN